MARTNGPLFSLDASGKLGNALVYGKWKGRPTVREYVTPANPRTLAQIWSRRALGALVALWQAMTTDERETWAADAAAKSISAFDQFVGVNLKRHTSDLGPIRNANGSGDPGLANGISLDATPGKGRVTLELSWDTSPNAGDLIVFVANTTTLPVTDSWRAIILGLVAADGSAVTRTITGLPPGTYTANASAYGPDGTAGGVIGTAGSFTIT